MRPFSSNSAKKTEKLVKLVELLVTGEDTGHMVSLGRKSLGENYQRTFCHAQNLLLYSSMYKRNS